MRTKLLNELKTSFTPYALLWDEWTNAKCCNLNQEEIYVVSVQIANEFKVAIGDFMMFYNKIEIIESVIRKLKMGYREFQEWVLMRFPRHLLSLTDEYNIQSFLETPIHQLSIEEELKLILKNFNHETLHKTLANYTDEDLKKDYLFQHIMAFQSSCKQKYAQVV
jgi:hypothetical protein